MRSRIAFALAMALSAREARADDGVCGVQVCPAGSPRAYEEISCDAPACTCWNSCDGSSGGGDKGKGVAFAIAFVVLFPIVPLMALEMVASKGEGHAFGRPDDAKQKWKEHRDEQLELARHGQSVQKEVDQLRDAVASPPRRKKPRRRTSPHQPVAARPAAPMTQEACSERYRIAVGTEPRDPNAELNYCECSRGVEVADCKEDRACESSAHTRFMSCLRAIPEPR